VACSQSGSVPGTSYSVLVPRTGTPEPAHEAVATVLEDTRQYRYSSTRYRYLVRGIRRSTQRACTRHVLRAFDAAPRSGGAQHCCVHDFRKLLVWQLSRELGTDTYRLCTGRPREEAVVTTQLRRAALSIAANIAEGCGKSTRSEVVRYLDIAAGSAAETEHHLIVWRDLGGITVTAADDLVARVTAIRRMLRALSLKLPE